MTGVSLQRYACCMGTAPKTLREMANVGPATMGDFKVLGISRVDQLVEREAFELWEDLCTRTKQRHDPCCIDLFMSVISQARGEAPCPWWNFTKARKLQMDQRPSVWNDPVKKAAGKKAQAPARYRPTSSGRG